VITAGERVGMLVVKKRDGKFAWCACDCGNRRRLDASRVARGELTDCGCVKAKRKAAAHA
jgi:hypothetical protein